MSADDHFLFGDDLDGALGCDVDNPAAHHLPVGQVHEDLVARALSRFGLVHEGQDAPQTPPTSSRQPQRDQPEERARCGAYPRQVALSDGRANNE
jgi:hypothetical protein